MVGTVPISVRLHRRCHRGGLCASLLLIACVVLMNMVAEETESGAKGTSEIAKKPSLPSHTHWRRSRCRCVGYWICCLHSAETLRDPAAIERSASAAGRRSLCTFVSHVPSSTLQPSLTLHSSAAVASKKKKKNLWAGLGGHAVSINPWKKKKESNISWCIQRGHLLYQCYRHTRTQIQNVFTRLQTVHHWRLKYFIIYIYIYIYRIYFIFFNEWLTLDWIGFETSVFLWHGTTARRGWFSYFLSVCNWKNIDECDRLGWCNCSK